MRRKLLPSFPLHKVEQGSRFPSQQCTVQTPGGNQSWCNLLPCQTGRGKYARLHPDNITQKHTWVTFIRKRDGDREIHRTSTFNNAVRILFALRGDEAFESLASRQWIVNDTIQRHMFIKLVTRHFHHESNIYVPWYNQAMEEGIGQRNKHV